LPKTISLYEFGGSESTIRHIQKSFVKFFLGCGPVLDIGCGRGVFLELLSDANIPNVGIDHSEEALAACRKKGLTVYREDAQTYLQQNPEGFGGIFCSHVIEHMGYDDALKFLALCDAALRPGGVILLVTPNPDDLTIMSEIFWLDPTHVRPYPKLLLQRMLQSLGFEVPVAKQILGSWRLLGKRQIPGFLIRRMLLGRHYGRPNTVVLAKKPGPASGAGPV
jgi:2-polyprenyl-3-methyl-5-hydroxy-6-metoxy-1,4-benzoquinol methylase